MRRGGLALLASLLALGGWLILSPSPIDPVAYTPEPAPPLVGVWEPNTRLRSAQALAAGQLVGPEDIEIAPDGTVYAGTVEGKIWKISPGGKAEVLAETGGRPLGVCLTPDGELIVADSRRGLLAFSPQGEMRVLATEAAGVPFRFTDDVDVAQDGTIYFSDASSKFTTDEYLLDLLEARPHGRLLKLAPGQSQPEVLLDGLHFANGVALSEDEDFVLVNETYRYRVVRYWLEGEKAGTHEVFLDNLPGFPDNIARGEGRRFWLALFTVRNPMLDWLAPRPALRGLLAKLPKAFWPRPEPYGLVAAIDESGQVVETLHDPGGEEFLEVTSALERNGTLVFGSLNHDRLGRLDLGIENP